MDLYRYYSTEEIADFINLKHTKHSNKRSRQRDIDMESIKIGLLYAKAFFKQGMIFYVVKNSDLPDTLSNLQKEKIKNLVVIVSGDSNKILTCYRNKNAMHNIKKKSKTLWTQNVA